MADNFPISIFQDNTPADAVEISTDANGNCVITNGTKTETFYSKTQVDTLIAAAGSPVAITSIDLAPTGTANEFTISVVWVDDNGDTQTTTDATPVTITVIDQAISVGYDNTTSGLTATTVQAAIDELKEEIDELNPEVTQTAHGLTAGQPIYFDGTNYVLAQSNDGDTVAVYAVDEVVDANTFTITRQITDTGVAASSLAEAGITLSAGDTLFVSATESGKYTNIDPNIADDTAVSNPLGEVLADGTIRITSLRPIQSSSSATATPVITTPTAPASPFNSSGFAQATSSNPAGASDGSTAYTCGDILIGFTGDATLVHEVYNGDKDSGGTLLVSLPAGTTTTDITGLTGTVSLYVYGFDGTDYSTPFVIGAVTTGACVVSAYVYISDTLNDVVHKINSSTQSVDSTISVSGNINHLFIENDYLYGVDEVSDVYQKIDLNTDTILSTLVLPEQLAFLGENGDFIYLYSLFTRTLAKVSKTSFTVVSSTTLANAADSILRIAGDFLYILDKSADSLTKFNLTSMSSVSTLVLGSNKKLLELDDNFGYVTDLWTDDLTKINLDTMAIVGTAPIGDIALRLHLYDGYAYVDDSSTDTAVKIDTSTMTSLSSVSLGPNTNEIRFDGDYGYALDLSDNRLRKFNVNTLIVENTLQLGSQPRELSIFGDDLYVLDAVDDTVTIIDKDTLIIDSTLNIGNLVAIAFN